MSATCVYIARKTWIHKSEPSKSLEKVYKDGKIVKHVKIQQLSNKWNGWNESKNAHEMSSNVSKNQRREKERLQNLTASQNFGGCHNHYNMVKNICIYIIMIMIIIIIIN